MGVHVYLYLWVLCGRGMVFLGFGWIVGGVLVEFGSKRRANFDFI